ncbi:MAG: Rieske (2Fe-2S) protein, partial [Bryobacteraceae bacterium]
RAVRPLPPRQTGRLALCPPLHDRRFRLTLGSKLLDVGFEKVARVEEVPLGQTRYVRVGRKPVLLANYKGRIYALSGICPHKFNPLDGSVLWDNLIDCPFHHFPYDASTGANHFPRNVYPCGVAGLDQQTISLPTYAVEVRGGEISVNVHERPR